jgi:hypothetical protein
MRRAAFFSHSVRIAAVASIIWISLHSSGSATMPSVSEKPLPVEACEKWAAKQSDDAYDIWGQMESGQASKKAAIMRLALSCLGDDTPSIVAAISNAGATEAYCAHHRQTSFCFKKNSSNNLAKTSFIFDAQGITNPENSSETIKILEKITPVALRRRFQIYKVEITEGEDCVVCGSVVGQRGYFSFDWGVDKKTITGISSEDPNARDSDNNRVGGSLRGAVGDNAPCDSGESLTCESRKIKGLSYIVSATESCKLAYKDEKTLTRIPECAKIAGFQLYAP